MARTSKAKARARAVAIVTGAGAGLGRAIAARLAADDYAVLVADVSRAGAEETAATIRAARGQAEAAEVDVSSAAAVRELFLRADAIGPLAVLVNNAGIAQPGPETEPWAFDKIVAVNLSGVRHGMGAALERMLPARRGVILNISSNLALSPWAESPLYSATKAGVIGLTTSVARHAGSYGVRVNAICPGAFPTAMISDGSAASPMVRLFQHLCPLGRVGRVEELAAAASFLASEAGSYLNGSVVLVDGGTVAW